MNLYFYILSIFVICCNLSTPARGARTDWLSPRQSKVTVIGGCKHFDRGILLCIVLFYIYIFLLKSIDFVDHVCLVLLPNFFFFKTDTLFCRGSRVIGSAEDDKNHCGKFLNVLK